jgi:hypothetical protein
MLANPDIGVTQIVHRLGGYGEGLGSSSPPLAPLPLRPSPIPLTPDPSG